MVSPSSSYTKVFISYSHKDIKHLKRLQTHLADYKRENLIEVWDDTKIAPGLDWYEEIKSALVSAKVAVLLVSADFLASRFIAENELPPLLAAAQTRGVIILPVILSPCYFEDTKLSQYQAVNSPSKPVTSMSGHQREALWANLAKLIKEATIFQKTASTSPASESSGSGSPVTPVTDDSTTNERDDKGIEYLRELEMQQPPKERKEQYQFSAFTKREQTVQVGEGQSQSQAVRTYKNGVAEFIAVEPDELDFNPVVVQALDNQWVPRSLLQEILVKGQFTSDIKGHLEKSVRTEYIRALINSRHIALNRAYLYNNPAVFQDYLSDNQDCRVFKSFLQEGIIIPALITEDAPDEVPSYGTIHEGFLAWQHLCQEVRMYCLRFSWDKKLNQEFVRHKMTQRFHNFALTANSRNLNQYINDLGLSPSVADALHKRLNELSQFCLNQTNRNRLVTRNELYKVFVTAGDNPAERLYDNTKPFAGEIKQLIDLAYNNFLAEALDGYLLTPFDSLTSIALQEWQWTTHEPKPAIIGSLVEITKTLRHSAFPLIQSVLHLKSLSQLSLQDVQVIRATVEWEVYIKSMETLLAHPTEFMEGAVRIFDNYTKLTTRITDLIARRTPQQIEELTTLVTPIPELVIDIGGAKLSITWTKEGLIYKFIGEDIPRATLDGASPFVAQLNIGNRSSHPTHPDLVTNLEFMKGKLQDAQNQWKEMQSRLKGIEKS